MTKKLKIGLFGVGQFGQHHLSNLLTIPHVELVGFCDIDKTKQDEIQAKFGVPALNREALIDASDMIDIVTPASSHFSIALEAIKKGKHVFVEK
ncbi:MAG: Gfo/Idh/MocA family oxidoreductase, partial [Candidatus Marinimicrobia bacterium]|nr:Gfo/Idh/MocA family oxidoreductase [Candidatus Neomarinimicrobiota bacterium]